MLFNAYEIKHLHHQRGARNKKAYTAPTLSKLTKLKFYTLKFLTDKQNLIVFFQDLLNKGVKTTEINPIESCFKYIKDVYSTSVDMEYTVFNELHCKFQIANVEFFDYKRFN